MEALILGDTPILGALFRQPCGGTCMTEDYADDHADDELDQSYENMGQRRVRPCALNNSRCAEVSK
jgi:hypothetical protein